MATATKSNENMWSLINYTDVWGNPVDGWEVNNLETMYEDLYIDPSATDQEILHYLKITGYFSTDNTDTVALEDYGDGMVEIVMCDDGFPLGRLQKKSSIKGGELCETTCTASAPRKRSRANIALVLGSG